MSILIRGREFPENCFECPCVILDDRVCQVSMMFEDISHYTNERPDWCPLVEVPTPHGDLIDRKGLLEQKAQLWDMNNVGLYGVGTGNILLMPAVIEAEE